MCCVWGRFHNQKQNATYSSSTFNVDNTDHLKVICPNASADGDGGILLPFWSTCRPRLPSPLTIKIEIRHKRCKWETPAGASLQPNGTNGWFPLQNIKSNRITKTNSGQNWSLGSFPRIWCIFRFVCRSLPPSPFEHNRTYQEYWDLLKLAPKLTFTNVQVSQSTKLRELVLDAFPNSNGLHTMESQICFLLQNYKSINDTLHRISFSMVITKMTKFWKSCRNRV